VVKMASLAAELGFDPAVRGRHDVKEHYHLR
jgi:hypothetical protein